MRKAAIRKAGVVRDTDLIAVTGDVGLPVGTPVKIEIHVAEKDRKLDRSVFGIWKDREDLKNPKRWVTNLRQKKWRK